MEKKLQDNTIVSKEPWLAGDIAAEQFGQISLIATNIIDSLGKAFSGWVKEQNDG